jgi:hypothetical protein
MNDYTNVKFMNLSQLRRIKSAGYVGEHNRITGRQRDYHDQRNEIDTRIWELEDKAMQKRISLEQHMGGNDSAETKITTLNEFLDVKAFEREELNEIVTRTFKPWRWLGYSLIQKQIIDASPY